MIRLFENLNLVHFEEASERRIYRFFVFEEIPHPFYVEGETSHPEKQASFLDVIDKEFEGNPDLLWKDIFSKKDRYHYILYTCPRSTAYILFCYWKALFPDLDFEKAMVLHQLMTRQEHVNHQKWHKYQKYILGPKDKKLAKIFEMATPMGIEIEKLLQYEYLVYDFFHQKKYLPKLLEKIEHELWLNLKEKLLSILKDLSHIYLHRIEDNFFNLDFNPKMMYANFLTYKDTQWHLDNQLLEMNPDYVKKHYKAEDIFRFIQLIDSMELDVPEKANKSNQRLKEKIELTFSNKPKEYLQKEIEGEFPFVLRNDFGVLLNILYRKKSSNFLGLDLL